MEGVTKLVEPLDNNVPFVAAEYQSIVSPTPGVAESVTVPVPQFEPTVPVGLAGIVFTVATIGVLTPDKHPLLASA